MESAKRERNKLSGVLQHKTTGTMIERTLDEDYIVPDRGGIVENRYAVHDTIVDGNGNLLYEVRDPMQMTLARPAAKPAQTLTVLETAGFDQFGFDDADLALMCASHSGESHHLARARAMLSKAGAEEGDLAYGGHPALSEAVNCAWIKRAYTPTAVCNNCSLCQTRRHAGRGSRDRGRPARLPSSRSPDPAARQASRRRIVPSRRDGIETGH